MRSLWRRLLELVARPRLDREAAEELAHHIELFVQAKRRAGFDEAEARRQARLELGSPDLARDSMGRTLSTESDAEVLITAQVSDDVFPILRVAPLLGRTFSEDRDAAVAIQ